MSAASSMISLSNHSEEPQPDNDHHGGGGGKKDRMDEILENINKKLEEMDRKKSASSFSIAEEPPAAKEDVRDSVAEFVDAEEREEQQSAKGKRRQSVEKTGFSGGKRNSKDSPVRNLSGTLSEVGDANFNYPAI